MSHEKLKAMAENQGVSHAEMQAVQALPIDFGKLLELLPQAIVILNDKSRTPFSKIIAIVLLLAQVFVPVTPPAPPVNPVMP